MKRILLFTFISIFLNSNLNAQEFVQKLDSEFCDCVSKETNYTDKTFEDCSEQVIPKYQNELEHFYSLEKNKNDRKNFMRDFMIRLIRKCDAFYYHMEATKKIGVNNFKKEYKTISYDSLVSKFKQTQLIEDYWEMANWKFANDDYLNAEKMYNEIIKNEPNQMESIYMLALLYDEQKQYEKAKALFDKVYEKNPEKIEYKLYSEMDLRKLK